MNPLKLIQSFFNKWVTSVNKSNYFEILVALEAPSNSLQTKKLGVNEDGECCKG